MTETLNCPQRVVPINSRMAPHTIENEVFTIPIRKKGKNFRNPQINKNTWLEPVNDESFMEAVAEK